MPEGAEDDDGPTQKAGGEMKREDSKDSKGSKGSNAKRKRPPPLEKQTMQKEEDENEWAEYDGDWIPMQSRTQGRPYYYHTETKETVWDMPPDYDDDLAEGAPGWVEMESRSQGRYYYYNQKTRECVWERPSGVPEPPPFERRRPNPKREALRDIIQDWADQFYEKHSREPTEEDIPPGTDIARHHRDYKRLKDEEEVERLKAEQSKLRAELAPDTRPRLLEIKESLKELEPRVEEWKKTKEKERARRDEVTQKYNGWIKSFTEEHGRGPTEKDIEKGSDIEGMFQEYSAYRGEARRAKERATRIEERKERQMQDVEHRKICQFMEDFKAKHGRKPTQKDLVPGSEIERLLEKGYQEYVEREMRLNPDSPNSKSEKVRRAIQDWSAKFEEVHGKRPVKGDIKPGTKIANLCDEYDMLLSERKGGKEARKTGRDIAVGGPADGKAKHAPAGRQYAAASSDAYGRKTGDWEEGMTGESPRSHAQYKQQQPPPGCGDCCAVM